MNLLHFITALFNHPAVQKAMQQPDVTYNPNPGTNIPNSSHNLQQVKQLNQPLPVHPQQAFQNNIPGYQNPQGQAFPQLQSQQFYPGNNSFQPAAGEGYVPANGMPLQGGGQALGGTGYQFPSFQGGNAAQMYQNLFRGR